MYGYLGVILKLTVSLQGKRTLTAAGMSSLRLRLVQFLTILAAIQEVS